MVLFHSDEYSPFGLDTEFAVPINEYATGTRDFYPGLCLKTVVHGSYSQLSSVYAKQIEWAEKEGYENCNALYEVYVTSPSVHTPLQESSKTADDGASAPREWCGCSGCMVHSGRRHGAHGRRAFPLFGNTFALAHGFTLDLDGVGVVDDPVTDGVGQGGVVQVLVPLAGVVLGAEDGGGHLAPGLY